MIFSKFFQPKYKHKDPLVRIQAITTLSAEEAQHKSVLHELAFNDSDNRVSVAALNKLNNFDLWWKMMEIAKDERLAKHARNKVEDALLGENDVSISAQARKTFIKECKNNSLLETLLQKQAIDETDTELYLAVLRRLNKAQLKLRTLLSTPNKQLQQALFSEVNDESDLARIVKKSSDSELTEQAQSRLLLLQAEKEKPVQLEKEVKLCLSRLLALSDETDFEKFSQMRQALEEEFGALEVQFSLLNDESAESFRQKLRDIQRKLDNKAQRLQGDWSAAQEIAKTSAALQSATQRCEQVLSVVEQALSNHPADITLGELESFNEQISQAEQALSDMLSAPLSDAEHRGIEKLVNQLMTSRTSLDALPALQQSLIQAEELLVQFNKLDLPQDYSQIEAAQLHLKETASRWKALSDGYKAIWPKALQKRWNDSSGNWRKAIKKLNDDLYNDVARIRGRFSGLSRAIEQGRFKNALRGYEQVKQDYDSLPESQQNRLSRQLEKVKAEIENLKDWQAYIAKPKKPELLREIEQLVLNPIAPEDQAERVKELRKEWNSLGVVDSEADEVMNKAFNLACEEAFKPCREYYAEQEEQRQHNLNSKKALLEELQQFPKDNIVELSKALRHLQSQWKNVGSVDYKDLEALNAEYKRVVEPVKKLVNDFHKNNAEAKQALLRKAQDLMVIEDWKEATELAKKFQEQWKQIEFAGQRLENKLWSEFRAINDQIFAKRESAQNAENELIVQQISAIEEQLKTAEPTMLESSSRAEIEAFLDVQLKPAIATLQTLPKKLNAKTFQFAQTLKATLEDKLLYLGDSQRTEQYQAVFDCMAHWQDEQAPEDAAELPNFWRQAFHTETLAEHEFSDLDRHQLTLLLELVLEQDSPEQDIEARKQVQLKLMTLKLQQGVDLEPDELLRTWINFGPLHKTEQPLLQRVKKLFLN